MKALSEWSRCSLHNREAYIACERNFVVTLFETHRGCVPGDVGENASRGLIFLINFLISHMVKVVSAGEMPLTVTLPPSPPCCRSASSLEAMFFM